MTISEWLDEQQTTGLDVAQMDLPRDMAYDEDPDETIFFRQICPCGVMCVGNHPFSTVERFGHWYRARGQDKAAKLHSNELQWQLLTKNRDLALSTARAHIE